MSRRERLYRLSLLICYTLLCLWGFSIAEKLVFLSPAVSLRYSVSPLSGEEAQHFFEKSAGTSFEPTLWRWEKNALRSGMESFDILWYAGEGAHLYPTRFVEGTYPSPADENGIALSVPLADTLYGSRQKLLGEPVELDHKKYLVRGVFESEDRFALAACQTEKDGAMYTGVELAGADDKRAALTFLTGNGLRQPDVFLDLPLLTQTAWLAAWLAPYTELCILLWRALRARGVPKRWIGYTLFTIACLGCGSFLSLLPAWLVPSRWSDFSFWGNLASRFSQDALQWLALGADMRDIQIKLAVFLLVPVVAGALFCAVKLAVRPGRKKDVPAFCPEKGKTESDPAEKEKRALFPPDDMQKP